ncbi:hypothetical protein [Flavobacterium caeni]|uniref:Uncharacterized protein n=1 Tax=Flavobacterium caeni TaxID=490189 RepID=A0A1G5KFI2_9FLAO|nr:hypothetical protein [Flavobacterium caeni]SCY99395.1 hypothetical protein SAMN02927903_03283 [Flavobacterium caeni]
MKYILILYASLSFGQEEIISENSDFLRTEVINTTIDDVLQNPSKFDNKIIKLDGYLDTQFEGMRIYADSSSYDLYDTKRSIYLRMTSFTPCGATRKKFATLTGKFNLIRDKYLEIKLYEAQIHKTLLTDGSKGFLQEILNLKESIINDKLINQNKLKGFMCFTDLDFNKVNGIYRPTLSDFEKLKEWYNENKFNISSYSYHRSINLIDKNGMRSKEGCFDYWYSN